MGDPTWAGSLAGVSLGLPVFHVTEPEIKAQIASDVYEAQVGLAEMVLDAPALAEAARECRAAH